ncbi:cation:proton antiporter, partial [Mycobacterium kansasii]
MIVDVVSSILFLTGAVFAVTAAIGIIRFPDTLTRMHAATKPQTLGMLLLLAGAIVRM